MNLINRQYKVVTYLGMTLAVPVDVQWIAIDKSLCVYGYSYEKPYIPWGEDAEVWENDRLYTYRIGTVSDTPPSFDWKQSLVCVGD